MKNKPVNKKTCSDCVHRWACAAWNIGSIANMDGTNCENFEKFDASAIPALVKCGECANKPFCECVINNHYEDDDFCSYGERKDGDGS